MGYAEGYYYGQGRIICDTSTFSVGDTIRVRSMTDSNKVWNQQVATVGTALVFTVPCYDYYKICTVQDIGGTPTEIGGVYKTVDYGQTLFINVLDKTTLGGIQGILNAHQEGSLLAIGDEVTITVGGSGWVMQLANIDTTNHRITLVSKNIYQMATISPGGNYIANNLRTIANTTFYGNISANDKQFIKAINRQCRHSDGSFDTYSDYVWLPTYKEVCGLNDYTVTSYSLLPLFSTQASRIRTDTGGTARYYWTSDAYNTGNVMCMTSTGGAGGANVTSNSYGVLPCFYLQADS